MKGNFDHLHPALLKNLSRAINVLQGRIDYSTQKLRFMEDPTAPLTDRCRANEAYWKEKIVQSQSGSLNPAAMKSVLKTFPIFNDEPVKKKLNDLVVLYKRNLKMHENFLLKLKNVQLNAHNSRDFEAVSDNIDQVYDFYSFMYHLNKFMGTEDQMIFFPILDNCLKTHCNEKYSDYRKIVDVWGSEKHNSLDALKSYVKKHRKFLNRNIDKYSDEKFTRRLQLEHIEDPLLRKKVDVVNDTIDLIKKTKELSAKVQNDRIKHENNPSPAQNKSKPETEFHSSFQIIEKTTAKTAKKKQKRKGEKKARSNKNSQKPKLQSSKPRTSKSTKTQDLSSTATIATEEKLSDVSHNDVNSTIVPVEGVASKQSSDSSYIDVNESEVKKEDTNDITAIQDVNQDQDQNTLTPTQEIPLSSADGENPALLVSSIGLFSQRADNEHNHASCVAFTKGQRNNLAELFNSKSFRFEKFRHFIKGLPGGSIECLKGSHFIVELPNVATGETDIAFVDSDHIGTTKGTVIRPHGKGSSEKLQGYYRDLAISCLVNAGITPDNFPVLEASLDKQDDGMIPHPAAGFLPN